MRGLRIPRLKAWGVSMTFPLASAVNGAPCQATPPGAAQVPLNTTVTAVPPCASPVMFKVVRAIFVVGL